MKPLGAFGPGGDLLKLHVGAIGPTRKKISLEIPTIFLSKFLTVFCHKKSMGSSPRLLSFGWNCVHFISLFKFKIKLWLNHFSQTCSVTFCRFLHLLSIQNKPKKYQKNCPPISFSFFIFSSVRLFRFCFDFCLLDSKLVETCLEVSAVANEYIIQRLNKSTPNLGGVQTLISNHSRLGVERTTWTEFSRLSDGKSRRGGMRMNFEPIRCIFAQIYAEKLGNV